MNSPSKSKISHDFDKVKIIQAVERVKTQPMTQMVKELRSDS